MTANLVFWGSVTLIVVIMALAVILLWKDDAL